MPQTQSAKRATRQIERRTARNLKIRTQVKKVMKIARRGTGRGLPSAFSTLDRAAKNNVIHWRAAARAKSRLVKLLAKSVKSKKEIGKKKKLNFRRD